MPVDQLPGRFLDNGRRLAGYADRILVVCPRCTARAEVLPAAGLPELRYYSELLYRPRRLVCARCGAHRDWTAQRRGAAVVAVTLGGPDEPFFGLPLWLQVPCRGRVLWAYDDRHLDVLADYVAAGLRQRPDWPSMSMLDRLPAWMKTAGNRADVLRAVGRLRTLLDLDGPGDGPATAGGRRRSAAAGGGQSRASRPTG